MIRDMDLCIINYNGTAYLEHTLRAVAQISQLFDNVFLVDNGSTDGSQRVVNELAPYIQTIPLDRNYGAGVARNAGFARSCAKRLFFIDNDVTVDRSCIETLSEVMDLYPAAAFAMPSIVFESNPSVVQYDGAGLHFTGLMVLENANTSLSTNSQQPRPINSLITACFIVDRERWGEASLFDDMFFYIFEDHELGVRARILGHEIIACPKAHAYHRDGQLGLSLRATGKYTSTRVHNTILNRWKVLLKLFETRTLILLSPGLLVFECFQFAGVIARGWFGEWYAALLWCKGNMRLLKRRRQSLQRRRVLPDRALLCGGPVPFTNTLNTHGLQRLSEKLLNLLLLAWWRVMRPLL